MGLSGRRIQSKVLDRPNEETDQQGMGRQTMSVGLWVEGCLNQGFCVHYFNKLQSCLFSVCKSYKNIAKLL